MLDPRDSGETSRTTAAEGVTVTGRSRLHVGLFIVDDHFFFAHAELAREAERRRDVIDLRVLDLFPRDLAKIAEL